MRLTPGWCRTLAIGWSGVVLALVSVGVSSHIIGRPVVWLDDQRWSPAVLGILAALVSGPALFTAVWSYLKRTLIPVASLVATVVLACAAIADRHASPGAAVVEGALTCAALLLTASSLAGRYRTVTQL